jgi:Septum formation
MRVGIVVLGLMLAACSGSHDQGSPPARSLDPFATKGPPATQGVASPPSGPPVQSSPVVAVGQCFDTDQFQAGSAIDLTSARVVDCAQPHQQEVYAIAAQPAGPSAPYPGDDGLAAFADDSCLAAFTGYTGLDYRSSHYDIANARPDKAAWDRGERRVICALHDADFAELTGSAKAGSG